jgi:hypothetical protein
MNYKLVIQYRIEQKYMIIPYSPINKMANRVSPISILNPLTNSDSPSNKSNGARPISTIIVIYKIMVVGNIKIKKLLQKNI